MKLSTAGYCHLPISPATAANSSRRHRRTLSATAKKPASLAGFLYLSSHHLSPHRSFSSRQPHFPATPRSLSVDYSNSK